MAEQDSMTVPQSPAAAPNARPAAASPASRRGWSYYATEYAIVWVMIAALVSASLISGSFLTATNIQNLLGQNTSLGLVALGMTLVMIGGGFDLSSGPLVGAVSVLAATLANNAGTAVTIVVTLLAGAAAGGVNALLVTLLRINPFVATLASGSAFTGVALLATHSTSVFINTGAIDSIGKGTVFGVRVPVVILVVLFVIGAAVLAKTVYGRALYAVGGNEQAARLAGLRVDLVKASTYVLVGVCAGAAGLMFASQLSSGDTTTGASITLQAITVVVIGGTSLFGGSGAVWRSAVGLVIVATITNIFDLLAIASAWQDITTGALVVLAVGFDLWVRRRSRRA